MAETYGFTVDVDGNVVIKMKQFQDAIIKTTEIASHAEKEVHGSFSKLGEGIKSIFGNLKDVLLGGLGIGAIFEGFDLLKDGIQDSVKLREAQAQLRNTMQDMGKFSQEAFDKMNEGMENLHSSTGITKNEIVSLQSQLSLIKGINTDEVNRITSVSADIAAKFHMGIGEAGASLSRALVNPEMGRRFGALLKIDPNVMKNLAEMAKHGQSAKATMDLLAIAEQKVHGAAQTAFETNPINFFKTKIADAFEEIGGKVMNVINSIDFQKLWQRIEQGVAAVKAFLEPLAQPFIKLFSAIMDGWKRIGASLSQFMGVGQGVFSWLRDMLGASINYIATLATYVGKFIAGVFDIVHTIIVLLQKIGVFALIGKIFQDVWSIIKGIGESLAYIYEHTIKPIIEKIEWAYNKIKSLLGITSNATVTVTASSDGSSATVTTSGSNISDPNGPATQKQINDLLNGLGGSPTKEKALKTSQLSGAKGGLGEAKMIKIYINAPIQKIEKAYGHEVIEHADQAAQELLRTINNLGENNGSSTF